MAQKFVTPITVESGSSASQAIAARVVNDAYNSIQVDVGGRVSWGDGANAADVTLYRDSANILKTDDAFHITTAGTALRIQGVGATSGGVLTITPQTGNHVDLAASNLTIKSDNVLNIEGRSLSISSGPTIGHATLSLNTSNGAGLHITGSNTNRRISIGNNVTTTIDSQLIIHSSTATYNALVLRGATSQTANIQDWQDVSGTSVASVSAAGLITSLGHLVGSSGIFFSALSTTGINSAASGESLQFKTRGNTPLTLNGSSSVSAAVAVTTAHPSGNAIILQANIAGATQKGLVVQGAASQTANLQEWSDSTGTALATMSANGNFAAATKSFDIQHPTKDNMRLRYGSVEAPEHSVQVRGRCSSGVIVLPDYWDGLVDDSTITVQLTAMGRWQRLFVKSFSSREVVVGGSRGKDFFYTVSAERKDVPRLVVEYGD